MNAPARPLPRALVTGAVGQLGTELQASLHGAFEVTALDRASLDLASPDAIRAAVREVAPAVLFNAGAYTAVDRAESEPELAHAVNAVAPGILAEEALALDALLVHYSTDYVFDGSKTGPWFESDSTAPLNVYGASKLAGEDAIRAVGGRHLIFRTSWVYGPQGKNFLLTMLRLGRERDSLNVVDDQIGSPTTSLELARASQVIATGILEDQFGAPADYSGIYHMTCDGSVSWCGFAQAIFARAAHLVDGRQPQVHPIPSSQYPTPARRPANSVLSNRKLFERFQIRLAPWEAALDEALALVPDPSAST